MNEPPLIAVRDLRMEFPGVVALDGITLDISRGEVRAIVGENGAGKSTLMKILAGVSGGYTGELRIAGQVVHFRGTRDAERAGVGIIHQELNLVESLSVAANIFLGRELRTTQGWLRDQAMSDASHELLAQLDCKLDSRQLVGTLRVGDQQLVEIAKALSRESTILIMDEPTSALTEGEVARLYRIVDRLRSRGVTILYISHKLDEVFHLASQITVLRDGRLVRTFATGQTNPREIAHAMVGRELAAAAPRTAIAAGEPLLKVRDLGLAWPGHARGWRLKGINLDVHQGEILGLAGLMGAGRTELLECLFGASPLLPTGQIWLAGAPAVFAHPADAVAAGVAMLTEDRKRLGMFPALDVGENITLCALREAVHCGLISPRAECSLADSQISDLQVKTPSRTAAITSLSGGNQQKALIGRWLLTQPRLLLLDDPTRGVDVGAKAELYRLMEQLCAAGLAIIVTSSELPELLQVSDRILVLCEGRLTGEFARGEATEERIMEAATQFPT